MMKSLHFKSARLYGWIGHQCPMEERPYLPTNLSDFNFEKSSELPIHMIDRGEQVKNELRTLSKNDLPVKVTYRYTR